MTRTGPAVARRRRSTVVVVIAVAVVAAAVALGTFLGPRLKSPAQAVADAAPPPASLVTAVVERRVLTETIVLRGTVVPGPSTALTVPPGLASPTAVVTAVQASPGTPLNEGAVLVEVTGSPLFGLVLPFPLYRDLVAGVTGPDVREVQKALSRLGFRTPVNHIFDASTRDALRRFYRSRGYAVPEQVANGAAPDGAPSGEPVSTAMLPHTHVVRLDRADHMISAVPVTVGAVLADPANVLIQLDTGVPAIDAMATQQQAALLVGGTAAEVVDDVRGLTSTAAVEHVGTEPTQAEGGTAFPVRLVFTGTELTPTPNHTVRVTIGTARDAPPVLAVPLTAVYSRPDGVTFATIVDEHDRTTDVTVSTGRSAGGWIEVTPQDGSIDVGDRVVVGSDFRPRAPDSTPPGG